MYLGYRGFGASKTKELIKIVLDDILHEFKLEYEQFVDLWILCGWDYTDKISNIGPVTALKLVQDYGSIDEISMIPTHYMYILCLSYS